MRARGLAAGATTGPSGYFRSYEICTFSGAPGPKLAEGDQQAPEGFYRVGRKPAQSAVAAPSRLQPRLPQPVRPLAGAHRFRPHGAWRVFVGGLLRDDRCRNRPDLYDGRSGARCRAGGSRRAHLSLPHDRRDDGSATPCRRGAGYWQNLEEGYDSVREQPDVPPGRRRPAAAAISSATGSTIRPACRSPAGGRDGPPSPLHHCNRRPHRARGHDGGSVRNAAALSADGRRARQHPHQRRSRCHRGARGARHRARGCGANRRRLDRRHPRAAGPSRRARAARHPAVRPRWPDRPASSRRSPPASKARPPTASRSVPAS